jgi:hypothetical protein
MVTLLFVMKEWRLEEHGQFLLIKLMLKAFCIFFVSMVFLIYGLLGWVGVGLYIGCVLLLATAVEIKKVP